MSDGKLAVGAISWVDLTVGAVAALYQALK